VDLTQEREASLRMQTYFRDTGCNDTNTHFGDQFDGNPGIGVGTLQVVDQLGQVLDGVDVVMRGRRDQAHPGYRVARFRDVLGHLVARQLPALARLGSLRHLDLEVVGVRQVRAGDSEATRGHLLDGGAPVVLRVLSQIPVRVFTCNDEATLV